jgi:signal transduction histidine kinase
LQNGRAEDEDWGLSAQGTRFYANVNITPLEDPGMNARFAVVVQDMTERRIAAIAREGVQQERMGLREKFLSHVSHELRTPLTAANFFVTNVLDGIFGDLNPEQHEHLSHGVDNLDQLTGMVGDLLEITRSETHKLSAVSQCVSPAVLITEALSTSRRSAVVSNVQLVSSIPSDLPFLWADPARVRQILINLLENGIKFTPAGGTVSLRCAARAEDGGFLCFSVTDTGCGISQENLDLVFDRLAQVESPIVASRSGLGLGLHIAKELVTLHGGRIWVESHLAHGSTFFFTLPIFSLEKTCAPILAAADPTASAVLITIEVVPVNAGIRKVLESCIRQDRDVLLPSMCGDGSEDIFFVVACTPPQGLEALTQRIKESLQNFDILGELKPLITANMLPVQWGQLKDQQLATMWGEIELALQLHAQRKDNLREQQESTNRG